MQQDMIPLQSKAAWRRALSGVPHSFYHTWESCYAMSLTSGYPTFLYVFEDKGTRIVCPVAERKFLHTTDIVTPFGFSGIVGNSDYPSFMTHWKRFMKDKGYVCAYISLNPFFTNPGYFDTEELHSSNSLYYLNLQKDLPTLLIGFDRNRRRQISHFEKNSMSVCTDRTLLDDFFMQHFQHFFETKGSPKVHRFTNRQTLSFLFGLENVIMLGMGNEKAIEAVSVFGFTEHFAEALFHISTPAGRSLTVPLLWNAIRLLKEKHIPYLNLGGGLQEGDSIAKFKERFGAQKKPLQSCQQIFNPQIYQALCEEAGIRAQNNNYFPAYRMKQSLVMPS